MRQSAALRHDSVRRLRARHTCPPTPVLAMLTLCSSSCSQDPRADLASSAPEPSSTEPSAPESSAPVPSAPVPSAHVPSAPEPSAPVTVPGDAGAVGAQPGVLSMSPLPEPSSTEPSAPDDLARVEASVPLSSVGGATASEGQQNSVCRLRALPARPPARSSPHHAAHCARRMQCAGRVKSSSGRCKL